MIHGHQSVSNEAYYYKIPRCESFPTHTIHIDLNKSRRMIDWEEWTGMLLSVWEEVPHKSIECASCKSSLWIIVPSSQCRGKLGQWPFVLGHLPVSACFGIYSPFVFFGKNPKVQHRWLTNMWLDVICMDVALRMHFPFLERPPTHRQAPPEKTTTFLDVDLFW